MSDRPEKDVLLEAVERFIDEVRPLIPDPRLAFRVLIAQNLVRMVKDELRAGGGPAQAELSRLRALSREASARVAGGPVEEQIEALDRALADRLRAGPLDEAERARIREHLLSTLRDRLAISNPRFDLRPEIE